jgi:hypothetical protein
MSAVIKVRDANDHWQPLTDFLETIPVDEAFNTCKRLIRDDLKNYTKEQIDACIIEMENKFNFTNREVSNLKKLCKMPEENPVEDGEGYPISSFLDKIDDGDPLKGCKDFILERLMSYSKSEVEACIIGEMKDYFKFNADKIRNLKQFYKEELAKKQEAKEEIEEEIDEIPESAKKRALEIMQDGNPIEFVLNVVQTYHVGDKWTSEGLCVSIAGQSCLNSSGIQIAVNGESGSGKSHVVKIFLKLIPAHYAVISALSPKAAYYMKLNPGMIVFSDDVSMSIDMEEIIKRATTNYQEYTEYNTVYNGAGKRLVIPPRINWYLTSVDSEASKEVLNRQLTFSTVENKGHKKTIFDTQADMAVSGIFDMTVITEDVVVCRAIFENIKSQTFNVKIPFAKQINIKNKFDSRVFPLFLDMIRGYAVFFHRQRNKDSEGFLLAQKEDFDKAKELFSSQLSNIRILFKFYGKK